MNRNLLFSVILFTISTFSGSAFSAPSEGQGIAYYRAGFPLVAKPLLIAEIESNAASRGETCFNLGNIYFSENQTDSAAYYFNKGLAADATNSLNSIGLTMLKIKSDPTTAETEFKNILKLKQNKKNLDIYLAIGNAYLFNGSLDNAVAYQEKAKEIKTKDAEVYVLLGDIEFAKKNVGEACKNYEQAIYFNDKCKEAYIKYARAYRIVNPNLAIEKLNTLKAIEPTFLLVDRELADIYYATNDFKKAAELYDNYLQSGNSNVQDLTKYAFTLFLGGDFAKSLEVTNLGLVKAVRNPVFNRLAMYNNVELTKTFTIQGNKDEAKKRNVEALKAADLFFNHSDKPEFTFLDHRYYGQAFRDEDSISLAISEYDKALQLDSTKTDLWRDISDMYSKRRNYAKSIDAFAKYFSSLKDETKTYDIYSQYGKLYYGLGTADSTLTVAQKKSALIKADSLFDIVATKEPANYLGNFWRARTNSALDPETEQGLAKPYYEKTVEIVEAKKADVRYNSILVESYSYLAYYYLVMKDNATSLTFWTKILTLDPTNVNAKKAIDGIAKSAKAKK